ncbi:MAG: GNAT family N-acetyltransferase [Oscillospiraceae bacterium]|nr:GNAT family N-acetyltransferase [Oscillospiraceae bacterium]
MTIVPMSVSDTRVLELFSEHDDYMIDFLGDDKDCYTRYSAAENIEKVWVVLEDNAPIGCVAYRTKTDDTGEVKRLFIRSGYRGKGISKALLSEVKSYAKDLGCTKLFLDTRITLEPAVSLYRSFGFEITFRQGLYIQMEMNI